MRGSNMRRRSKAGCLTCRSRKLKCGEEKPHCSRCITSRLQCNWNQSPAPVTSIRPIRFTKIRTPAKVFHANTNSSLAAPNQRPRTTARFEFHDNTSNETSVNSAEDPTHPEKSRGALEIYQPRSLTRLPLLQVSNSLVLSSFDRKCLDFFQDSFLVIYLGKRWEWSTLSYVYHEVAVTHPMVMHMILATSASELRRIELDNQNNAHSGSYDDAAGYEGRRHYNEALLALNTLLNGNIENAATMEAVIITLWFMLMYEIRFGRSGVGFLAHMKGIKYLFAAYIGPINDAKSSENGDNAVPDQPVPTSSPSNSDVSESSDTTCSLPVWSVPFPFIADCIQSTSACLFLLWIIYLDVEFAIPGTRIGDNSGTLFRTVLYSRAPSLDLEQLHRYCRSSAARFWTEKYPIAARLDDFENSQALILVHKCRVIQFKITEAAQILNVSQHYDLSSLRDNFQEKGLLNHVDIIFQEYDIITTTAQFMESNDITDKSSRVYEMNLWASIHLYGVLVYFFLCFPRLRELCLSSQKLCFDSAVTNLLKFCLKLYRFKPRLLMRTIWPLFVAGLATSDSIHQHWIEIRLREMSSFGANYAAVSSQFQDTICALNTNVQGPDGAAKILSSSLRGSLDKIPWPIP